jgi:hypothetical protein
MGPAPLSRELFESTGITVTDTPRVDIEPLETVVKVDPDQPSIIRRGQAALERLEQSRDFQDWADLTNALAEVQTAAMAEAATNAPQGAKYRKAIAKKLRIYGFDHIHKSTRSFLLKQVKPNLEAMTAWRAKQSAEVQFDLNHPRVVLTWWKRSLKQPKSTDPGDSDNDENNIGNSDGLNQVVAWWQAASASQRAAFLAALELTDILEAMPTAWREKLKERALGSLEASCSSSKSRAVVHKLRKQSMIIDLVATPIA